MKLRTLFFIFFVIVFTCQWYWKSRYPFLDYSIVVNESGNLITVEISIDPKGHDTITFRPLTHDLDFPLEDLKATCFTDDAPVKIEHYKELREVLVNQKVTKTFQTIHLNNKKTKLTYQVKPVSYRVGGTCRPRQQHSLHHSQYVIMNLSSLLLLPTTQIGDLSITVKDQGQRSVYGDFNLINTWPIEKTYQEISRFLLLNGNFEWLTIPLRQGTCQLALSDGYSSIEKETIYQWLQKVFSSLEIQLGDIATDKFSLILVPPQGVESFQVAQHSTRFHVAELSATSEIGRQQFVETLALRMMGFVPAEIQTSSFSDAWFIQGLARLVSRRALLVQNNLADHSIANEFQSQDDIALTRPPNPLTATYLHSRPIKGACAVLLLESELARWGMRENNILSSLWQNYQQEGILKDAVSQLIDDRSRHFFNRWIDNYNRLLNPFPFLLRKNPFKKVVAPDPKCLDVTILMSSHTQSFLETCGCKINQSGGLAKRKAVIDEVKYAANQPVIVVDLGGFFPQASTPGSHDELSKREIQLSLQSMKKMNHDAVVVGVSEILHGQSFFNDMIDHVPDLNFLSTDLELSRTDSSLVVPISGKRIAFIGLAGNPMDHPLAINFESSLSQTTYLDFDVVSDHIKSFKKGNIDYVIVMGNVPLTAVDELVQRNAAPDLVLDLSERPLWRDFHNDGSSVYLGNYKGVVVCKERMRNYGISRLDLSFDESSNEILASLSVIQLDDTVKPDQEISEDLDRFYLSLKIDETLKKSFKPLFTWDTHVTGSEYIGSSQCQVCHVDQHRQWRTTKHAQSMRTLIQNHRNYNPKCVVCHVTGMGYPGGYTLSKPGHKMENVQCEVCHGPGKNHVLNPSHKTIRKTPTKNVCFECHNKEHSDFFESRFEKAWQRVRH